MTKIDEKALEMAATAFEKARLRRGLVSLGDQLSAAIEAYELAKAPATGQQKGCPAETRQPLQTPKPRVGRLRNIESDTATLSSERQAVSVQPVEKTTGKGPWDCIRSALEMADGFIDELTKAHVRRGDVILEIIREALEQHEGVLESPLEADIFEAAQALNAISQYDSRINENAIVGRDGFRDAARACAKMWGLKWKN